MVRAGVFETAVSFETAQRIATALSKSDLVPKSYQGNVANCLVALEVANRTGASPLMVMQNLNIIHGKPSWSSQYIISAVNACGRFAPLKFKFEGTGMARKCHAYTSDLKTGEVLTGPEVSMEMAKSEGWIDKAGSKWKTMPDLMLTYRAGAFFGRIYAPEILMGMRSEDENREILTVESEVVSTNAVESLNEKIKSKLPE